MAAIKFSKQNIQPNPLEVDYWVDITSNPYGGNIKYHNGYDWVDLLNSKGTPINLDAYYNKVLMNQMLAGKASVESVDSKVDDTEVADVIKNIEFKDRGDDGVEMVVLKYNDMTVGVTLPVASNTTSGIITNKSFKDLVKQNQLQGVYSEMYDKLSEIRQQYQRKLKAGKNIQIDSDNTIHAVGEISLDWDDVYNKPDFDKLFAAVALAIQSESTRAKNAEQQLSARITDHVDVVESKLELKADANSVYTKDQIDEKISGIYKIKGSRTFQDLPTSGNTIGDVYNITNNFSLDGVEYPFGTNVVYTATGWDALAGIFDSTEIENKVDEIDTKVDEEIIRAKEKELELDEKFDNYLPLSGGTLYKSEDNPIVTFKNNYSPAYINFKSNYANGGDGSLGVISKQLKYIGSDSQAWNTVLHEGNYSNYALPLTGGKLIGDLQIGEETTDNTAVPNIILWKGDGVHSHRSLLGTVNDGTSLSYYCTTAGKYGRLKINETGMYFTTDGSGLTLGHKIYHEGNFNPNDYLPLSGGIVTGVVKVIDSNVAPFIVNTNNTAAGILLMSNSGSGYFLYYGNNDYYVTDNGWNTRYKIWHEGNDGSGSGLDADTLDGVDGSNYFTGRDSKNIDFNQLHAPNIYNKSGLYHLDDEWSQQNAPFKYGTLLAFNSNSAGIQLASSGPLSTPPDLKYRKRWLTGFSDWKTIAFTDSDITGNAATATKATQDSEGNVITDTYALKSDLIIGLNVTDGVYAVKADGSLCTIDEADTSCTGVALVAGEHKFMIAKSDAIYGTSTILYWGKNLYGKDVAGITNIPSGAGYIGEGKKYGTDFTTWSTGPVVDFNGKANTAAIIAAYSQHSVAMDAKDMCKVLETFNAGSDNQGHSDWYVPACGQLALMYLAKTDINAALAKIGGTAFIESYYYWSSSEYDASSAWYMGFGYGDVNSYGKFSGNRVRFIRDIQIESSKSVKESITEIKNQLKQPASSALKLATPVKLWGNTFDGSNSVNGSMFFENNSHLHIADNQNNPTSVLVYNDSNLLALGYSSSGKGHKTSVYGSPIDFCTGTDRVSRMIIDNNGNVGIGTTNPLYKLDVNGYIRSSRGFVINNEQPLAAITSDNRVLQLLRLTDANTLVIGQTLALEGFNTYLYSNQFLIRIGKDQINSFVINSSGNVTIGSSDLAGTTYKLWVDGSTKINGHLIPHGTNTKHLGSESEKWQFAYISDRVFIGNIGNKYSEVCNGSLELYHDTPFIDFHSNSSTNDYTSRIIESSAGKLKCIGSWNVTNSVDVGENLFVKDQITSGDLVDWYGVSWSENSSDPTCTRIGNMALHRSLPILSAMKGYVIVNKENPVSEGLIIPLDDNWSSLKYTWATNNVSDGFNHITFNTMVKIPEFWYIDYYEPSTKTHNLKISQTAKAGWIHHKEAYVGAYEGSYVSLGYRSKKGEIPLISWSRTDLRNAARANGYEDEYKWNIYTYEEHRAICHLFLVEYATRNSLLAVNTTLTSDGFKQGGLGSGCTTGIATINGQTVYSFIPTGTTDSLGNGSGQVAYTVTQTDTDGNEIGTVTRYANRYRGIENPFGHILKHVDDIVNVYNAETTYNTVYKCNKPEHFATNKNAKYKPLCSFPGGSKMQGWSKEIKATVNCDFFKYSVGGSESTYWCDYNYDNDDTTEHCLLIGGASGYGDRAGLFGFALNSGVGTSDVSLGSRLTYLPWAE